MELKMNYNSFIKLKDFLKIIDLSAEVDEYNIIDESLEGNLNIKGKYIKRDNVTDEYFLEKIPFSIFINNKEFEINDIYCVDIEHVGIEGRGIDVSFDIFVNYDFLSEEFREKDTNVLVNKIESLETNHVNEQDFEQLKSLETNRVDDLLKTTLIGKDNSPTEDIVIRNVCEDNTKIKICYYNTDKQLEDICFKNDLSIEKVYNDNKKYDFNKYHRVILNEK